jgi:hypothetical protein
VTYAFLRVNPYARSKKKNDDSRLIALFAGLLVPPWAVAQVRKTESPTARQSGAVGRLGSADMVDFS